MPTGSPAYNLFCSIVALFGHFNPATGMTYSQADIQTKLGCDMNALIADWNFIAQTCVSYYQLHGAQPSDQDVITAWQLGHFDVTDPPPPGYTAVAGMAWEPVPPTETTTLLNTTLDKVTLGQLLTALGK